MAKVPASRHNGFHLVYADEHDVLATISSGTDIAQLTLGRGIHVVTERSFAAGDDRLRRSRIDAAWARLATAATRSIWTASRSSSPSTTTSICSAATCIHAPGLRYGTRSGTAIAIAQNRAESRMLWAEGPPCTTPFTADS